MNKYEKLHEYEGGATLDKILYPIGSIYINVNPINISQLFGDTWTQISGRFLYCITTSKKNGGGQGYIYKKFTTLFYYLLLAQDELIINTNNVKEL